MTLFDQLTQKETLSTKILKEGMTDMNEHISRIENIVNSLRAFTNDDFFHRSIPIEMNPFLNKYLQEKETRLIKEKIEFKYSIPENDAFILGHQELLEKVFDNLINNSIEAILAQQNPWIKVELTDSPSEKYWLLTFTDSGNGIDHKIAEHIMEPFFSHKKNTEIHPGVGLPLCINILRLHKATLSLNEQSLHTQFVIKFPKLNKKD